MEGKTIDMGKKKEVKKLTYEELEQVANQMNEQNQILYEKIKELNLINVFRRLDYLFKVVENKEVFDKEFTDSVVKEIKDTITVEEEDSINKEDNEA